MSSSGNSFQSHEFDRFIILDLGTGGQLELYKKLKARYPSKRFSFSNVKDENGELFQGEKTIDSPTRIYIIAHGGEGLGYVQAENGSEYSVDQLAKALSRLIGEYDCNNGKVEVNLIVCHAASSADKEKDNSLARQLADCLLNEYDKKITVIARARYVDIEYSGRKYTSAGLALRKQNKTPGVKYLFTHDENGDAIKVDAYRAKWKSQLMDALKKMTAATTVEEKKDFLKAWVEKFQSESAETVYETVKNELDKSDSIISKHSSGLLSALSWVVSTATYSELKELIWRGRPYFQNSIKAKPSLK